MLNDLFEFAACCPAWCGPDGYPLSWRHYVTGLPYVTRARLRTRLDIATATAAAGASEQSATRWFSETARDAGWTA